MSVSKVAGTAGEHRNARAGRSTDGGDVGEQVDQLLRLTARGLPAAYDAATSAFAQTVRPQREQNGTVLRREGTSARYTAIAALGIDRLDVAAQREVLAGRTAAELTGLVVQRARTVTDPGALALAAWAGAEVAESHETELFARLETLLATDEPMPVVALSWVLTAAVAAAPFGDTAHLTVRAADRLLKAQSIRGLFPHVVPARTQRTWRVHVGSFADQAYPVQALARAFTLTGDRRLLDAADVTADRLCELQGPAGQWWWHYDVRDGSVLEGYPVYSVHQHAMAPMALLDHHEAGGSDHGDAVARGLRWLESHPEVVEEIVSERHALVWRKVGRREPLKAARAVASALSAVRVGARVRAMDRLLPPVRVDYECRPYELGWLLYAWLPPRRHQRKEER